MQNVEPETSTRRLKRRERKSVPRGRAYIKSTFNNTLVTLTDPNGNVIAWASSGGSGFKGSRKGTPFAAQLAGENAARRAMEHGLQIRRSLCPRRRQWSRSGDSLAPGDRSDRYCHSRCHPHPTQRLPRSQAAPRIGAHSANGTLHRPSLPPLPPSRRKALPQGRPMLHPQVQLRSSPQPARTAPCAPPQDFGPRSSAARKAARPRHVRSARKAVRALLQRSRFAAPAFPVKTSSGSSRPGSTTSSIASASPTHGIRRARSFATASSP